MNRPLPKSRAFAIVLLVLGLSGLSAAEAPKAPVPKSPYISVVYRYADTLLERGQQKTGKFVSGLERATLAPMTNRLETGPEVGKENLVHHENLFRLLYTLSELSGKPKYREAADAALKEFLQKGPSAAGPLDVWKNDPQDGLFRPWLLWDRCFALAPQASVEQALAFCEYQRTNQAAFGNQAWRWAGFFLRTWAVAYAHTHDARFLDASEALRQLCERQPTEKFDVSTNTPSLSFVIDCDGAANRFPAPLAKKLRQLAARKDALALDLLIALKFSQDNQGASFLPLWVARSGDGTLAQLGMICLSRYDNAGQVAYREWLVASADAYRDSTPPADMEVWPLTFGQAISLELGAWRHTARPAYLDSARRLGDLAVEKFWGKEALPRASLKAEHFEARTGGDTLALALLELHLNILHITAVRCPPNTIDR